MMLGIISAEKTHMFLTIWKLPAKVNSVKQRAHSPSMHLSSLFDMRAGGRFSVTQWEFKLPVSLEINGN